MNTTHDALGVTIEVGDTVFVSAWGGNVRLSDTARRAEVVRVTAHGNVVLNALDLDGPIARGTAVHPGCLSVLRRDGQPGFEGNR